MKNPLYFLLHDLAFQRKVLGVLLLGMLFLQIYSLSSQGYSIVHQDEGIFEFGSRLFAETNSPVANSVINENVSKIGAYNWYGPFWNILFGFGVKIFGSEHGILMLNLVFAWLTVVISLFFIPKKSVLFTILLVVSYPFLVYQTSIVPEPFMMLLAVINLVLLFRLIENPSPKGLVFFSLIIYLEIVVRVTNVFWLFGLIPMFMGKVVRNKLKVLSFFSLMFGVVWSYIFLQLFMAPAFDPGISNLASIGDYNLVNFLKILVGRPIWNFVFLWEELHPIMLLLLVINGMAVIMVIKKVQKVKLEFVLVSCLSLVVFWVLYLSKSLYFLKQTAFVWPVLIFLIISSESKRYKYFLIAGLFGLYPFSFVQAIDSISSHKSNYDVLHNSNKLFEAMNHLKGLDTKGEQIYLLWIPDDWAVEMSSYFPATNFQGKPLIYTCNPTLKPSDSVRFKLFNRLKIDFCIVPSKRTLDSEKFELQTSNGIIDVYSVK